MIRLVASALVLLGAGAAAAGPDNWNCSKETRDGVRYYVCRDCGPPQPEADELQICQVRDFEVGVEAFERDETELIIIVTPYLQPGPSIRPADRFELRRAPKG